jgi:RimJ/RimL family protein N-acetyltransferase
VNEGLEAFLKHLVDGAKDSKGLQRYAEACPVPGVEPDRYAPRLLALEPVCTVIAQIHFMGMDLSFPFVDISAQSAAFPNAFQAVMDAFREFRPRAVRLWRLHEEDQPQNSRDDLMVFAAPVDTLRRAPRLPRTSRITLESDPKLDSYPIYREMAATVMAANPSRAEFMQVEEQSSLLQCAKHNAFFQVMVDGSPAGFIAARPDRFRAWQGWCMVEELLHPFVQGQGLAPAMQQAFIHKLDPQRGSIVFGTIDARNVPSWKTARRVGRQVAEIGTFVFPVSEEGSQSTKL